MLIYYYVTLQTRQTKEYKSYKNNKLKISVPTWNEKFELPDG